MLKLNLLPASYTQGGSVKSVAFLVLVVWLLLLAALGFYAWNLKSQSATLTDDGKAQQPTIDYIGRVKADETTYESELSTIKPETEFLDQAAAEPRQITDIMRVIARATPSGVVIEKYDLSPGTATIALTAFAMDYHMANRWRYDLYTDPDFTNVDFPSLAGRGGCGSSSSSGGSGGPPGMGGMGGMGGGYPGMGGGGMGRPSATGFGGMGGGPAAGGAGGGAGGTSQFSFPCSKFPDGRTLAVTVTIKHPYTEPTFPPPDTSAAAGGGDAAGGMGGMGGYPGMSSGGGYPGMSSGGGYPGMPGGGGYPGGAGGTAAPAGGTTTTGSGG